MPRSRGFTLVEMVVFIVVLAVGITGALSAIIQSTRHAADPLIHLRAAELGQSYLDEIAAVPYAADASIAEPCPAGERGDWMELECYAGLDEQPPQNAMGTQLTGYADYRVTVAVASETTWGGATGRWVNVTVRPPGSTGIRFDLFRGEPDP